MKRKGSRPEIAWSNLSLQPGDLPAWGSDHGLSVFPLLLDLPEFLRPVGTAFCVTRSGLIMMAMHSVLAALDHHPRGEQLKQRNALPSYIDLGSIGLSVLRTSPGPRDGLDVSLLPLQGFAGAPPSDVGCGFLRPDSRVPMGNLAPTFSFPRVGSRVFALGYTNPDPPDETFPSGRLSRARLLRGEIRDWDAAYRHRFRVIEGRVVALFPGGFSRSYCNGPCFAIDAEVSPGMSGGPVFDEVGRVCGMVYAGASSFFPPPAKASLVSALFAGLMVNVQASISFGPQFQMNFCLPLLQWLYRAGVTDGSEEKLGFSFYQDGTCRIDSAIDDEDWGHAFDDFSAYQEGRPAEATTEASYRLRPSQDPANSEASRRPEFELKSSKGPREAAEWSPSDAG